MLRITHVSFPGLGIGEFTLESVAFSIGKINVAWYGIIITTGIVLAALYVIYRAKQLSISSDTVLDLGLYTVIIAIVCARLFYVLTSLERYTSFWDVFKIWEGGLAIYGAIIGGALTILVYCRINNYNFFMLADMIAPSVMIGQILGRWGNFMNGEAFGGETDIFCRMGIRRSLYQDPIYVHPTFLYESLWNLIGFLLINAFYRKKKYNGQILYMYLAWYGFGRMFIEQLRSDSLYLGNNHVWYMKISSIIGCLCFLICGTLLIYHAVKGTKHNIPWVLRDEEN